MRMKTIKLVHFCVFHIHSINKFCNIRATIVS